MATPPNERAERSALLIRVAQWMRRRRLDAEGAALLADVEATLPGKRGRKSKITTTEAVALLEEHGNAEAAARAHGGVTGETIRRLAKAAGS